MNPSPTSRALFLDRDGVVNHEVGYLSRAEDVCWMEGIIPLCLTAQSLGYKLVVVTNQSGIGRGLYSEHDFQTLMSFMRSALSREKITLDAVYHCPYHPVEGVGDYKREHEDRKPSPGMLRRAARDLLLDLTQCILVGDRCSDIAAANAAGLKEAFLLSGTEENPCSGHYVQVESLSQVEHWIRRQSLVPSS
jgi:D-glycero-D-manno-heptose 1,7-bisphosphate phosphatase